MASADLRDELTCSICLNIYTYPVTLPCGHSFCRTCIGDVLDTQEGSGAYKCPECRAESQERPALVKNRKLRNIAENIRSTHPEQEEGHKWPAGRYFETPVLEYYCCEDTACICVSCSLAGEHRGHQVETLNEASEKKKEKLKNILQKLTSQREEVEKRVQNLEEDIRKQLEALEKRVLSEISRQEEQVSLRVSDLIRQLEIKKEELSRKMGDIEELCDMTDPVTVLQGRESDRDDYCDTEEDTERRDIKVHDAGDLDVGLISVTLHSGLAGIVTGITRRRRVPEASDMLLDVNTASDMLLDVNTASDMLLDVNTASDMLLDVNTAGNGVSVSEDLKTVSWSGINQRRPETPERFQCYQVLSSRSFSSGRHYWEVEGSESGEWRVGMIYPSIERRGGWQSVIGNNNKSWCLQKFYNKLYYMRHDSNYIPFYHSSSCHRFGIFLDYEAGRLSFYELCHTALYKYLLHADKIGDFMRETMFKQCADIPAKCCVIGKSAVTLHVI
uniref:Uncharacterized protein n=1 Tax=Leptobrachium leishanense TaxID=445787 RepID=A0A8C5QD16_9ANUR